MFASNSTIGRSIKISEITGIEKTTVGFVLIGFSTSLANLSVALFTLLNPQENIGFAVGNVLGSNIVNIALVLGICILMVVLKRPRYPSFLLTLAKGEMGSLNFGLFIASIIPLTLLYIGYASRFVGVALIGIFVFYMVLLARRQPKEGITFPSERKTLRRQSLLVFGSAAIVVASAFFIIESATFVATSVGVPSVVIGATIVAFGTSIPVFFTSTTSVRKGHFDLALSNIIGECFINITLILGVALVASSSVVNIAAAFSNVVLFSLIANLFLWYFLSSERISWREGALLVFLYAIFLIVTFGGYRT